MDKTIDIYILLVLLTANYTHLIQPLAITVFNRFKTILKQTMDNFMIDKACTTLSKKYALKITLKSWEEGILMNDNKILAGLKSSGIFTTGFT